MNVIPGTTPRTFTFARNWWHCMNDPAGTKRLVRLPAPETDGVYGRDPQFRNAAKGDLRIRPNSPAKKVGAEAMPADLKTAYLLVCPGNDDS